MYLGQEPKEEKTRTLADKLVDAIALAQEPQGHVGGTQQDLFLVNCDSAIAFFNKAAALIDMPFDFGGGCTNHPHGGGNSVGVRHLHAKYLEFEKFMGLPEGSIANQLHSDPGWGPGYFARFEPFGKSVAEFQKAIIEYLKNQAQKQAELVKVQTEEFKKGEELAKQFQATAQTAPPPVEPAGPVMAGIGDTLKGVWPVLALGAGIMLMMAMRDR